MNIAFIPIDNRPVCYTLPTQICSCDSNINLFMPNRCFLGDLTKYANIEEIFKWIENLSDIDALIISLDTIAYGGLISSRRSNDTFEQIKHRIEKLKDIVNKKGIKVYAFSSVMRISNNNINEEEKEYWDKWGKKIFNYSYCLHKFGSICKKEIPDEILDDYLATRKRNFEINKLYLQWQKEGFFDTLVFSKDDCADYGFNVQEAVMLEALGGIVKTGADEIPISLLARAVNQYFKSEVKICPKFMVPEQKNLISNYEDISIEKSVLGQLKLAGCKVSSEDEADILLYINNFEEQQGEIVMRVLTKPFSGDWHEPDKPYLIADVRYANGSDNVFVEKLFQKRLGKNFLGYAAWNTSANTLGSLICMGVILWHKGIDNCDSMDSFVKLQITRFLDDWAYQANVRQMLSELSEKDLKNFMKPFEDKLFEVFHIRYNVNYKFPWNRLFEVEIELS